MLPAPCLSFGLPLLAPPLRLLLPCIDRALPRMRRLPAGAGLEFALRTTLVEVGRAARRFAVGGAAAEFAHHLPYLLCVAHWVLSIRALYDAADGLVGD